MPEKAIDTQMQINDHYQIRFLNIPSSEMFRYLYNTAYAISMNLRLKKKPTLIQSYKCIQNKNPRTGFTRLANNEFFTGFFKVTVV